MEILIYVYTKFFISYKEINKEILSTPICQELFELYYLIKFSQSYKISTNYPHIIVEKTEAQEV